MTRSDVPALRAYDHDVGFGARREAGRNDLATLTLCGTTPALDGEQTRSLWSDS